LTDRERERALSEVFAQLFSAEGSEIYLRPAAEYVRSGAEVSFATVVEAARRRGECAIGYRETVEAGEAAAGFGVRVNPPKSELFQVAPGDRVIVLAED
jgi:hypothetical protein